MHSVLNNHQIITSQCEHRKKKRGDRHRAFNRSRNCVLHDEQEKKIDGIPIWHTVISSDQTRKSVTGPSHLAIAPQCYDNPFITQRPRGHKGTGSKNTYHVSSKEILLGSRPMWLKRNEDSKNKLHSSCIRQWTSPLHIVAGHVSYIYGWSRICREDLSTRTG